MHNAARYVLGGFAGAAIVSGVGISVAMANDSQDPGRPGVTHTANFTDEKFDGFIERLAANLGISVEELRAAIEETLSQEIGIAADEGELPRELADTLQDEIAKDLFDGEIDIDSILDAAGGIPEIQQIQGDLDELQAEIAGFLGTDEAEIESMLDDGMSLGEIAESFDKTPEEISQFLLDKYLDAAGDERIPREIREGMSSALSRLIELYLDGELNFEELFGEAP